MTDDRTDELPRMMCGHTANATRHVKGEGVKPVCVICLGIVPGADTIDEDPPSVENRVMRCGYCRSEEPSDPTEAFFEHRHGMAFDSFYCGCRGWD